MMVVMVDWKRTSDHLRTILALVCIALAAGTGCEENPGCELSVTPTLCGPQSRPCTLEHDEVLLDSTFISEPSIAVDASGIPSVLLFSSAPDTVPSRFLKRSGPGVWESEALPMIARLGVLSASVSVGDATACEHRALIYDGMRGVTDWCHQEEQWTQLASVGGEVYGAEDGTVAFAPDGTGHAILYRFWDETLLLANSSQNASWTNIPLSESWLTGATVSHNAAMEPHVAYWRLRPGQDNTAILNWRAPDGHEEHVLDWPYPGLYDDEIKALQITVGPPTPEQPRGQPSILLERPCRSDSTRPSAVDLARRQGPDDWRVTTVVEGKYDIENCSAKWVGDVCDHHIEDVQAWALLGNRLGEQRVIYSWKRIHARYLVVLDQEGGKAFQGVEYEATGEIRIAWIDDCGHAQSTTLVPDTCVFVMSAALDERQGLHLILHEKPCNLEGSANIRYVSFTSAP